ncbi:MAG: DUF2935 domain-containing protein [Lachnospiraceae bacterium]|nr:DUF2935 domain-containing protein [Lachnospiraceae bacterium]
MDQYVTGSLELHLFFGRIMKEHALFLKAGFTPVNLAFMNRAEFFKREFEKLLSWAVMTGDGIVGETVLCSGEVVTEFTLVAEKKTEGFTGISINKEITERELRMKSGMKSGMEDGEDAGGCSRQNNAQLRSQVQRMNCRALELLDGLISFKELILEKVLKCEMFTMNYPLLLEHILREAKLYRSYVETMEKKGCLTEQSMQEVECFWNQIMMEHALFIRGLLDPEEIDLICSADGFANEFEELLETCRCAHDRTMTRAALEEMVKFRDFKRAGTEGIEQCKIRSLILPLLADHVLREANHYVRLLEGADDGCEMKSGKC